MSKITGVEVLTIFQRLNDDFTRSKLGTTTVAVLSRLASDEELYVEFWRRLATPNSLEWLATHGFISARSLTSAVGHVQLAYLLRSVGHAPEVADTLLTGYLPKNFHDSLLLLEIALAAPRIASIPAVMSTIVGDDFTVTGPTFSRLYGKLAKRLKEEDLTAFHAITLKVIAWFAIEGDAGPDTDDVEEFFKESHQPDPALGQRNIAYLKACCVSLIRSVAKKPDDLGHLSTLWIASFVDESDNNSWDAKTALTRAIIRFAACICTQQTDGFTVVAGILQALDEPIFFRIYLHLMGKHGSRHEIASVLADQGRFDNVTIKNEMANLFRAHFGNLPEAVKQQVLTWIKAGPVGERTPDQADQWRFWKLSWIATYLDGQPRRDFDAFTERFGGDALALADRNHHTSHGWGSVSPFSLTELAELAPEAAVARITAWAPTASRGFRTPSAEGLAETFQQVVAKNAVIWSTNAMVLTALQPCYLERAFSGWLAYAQNHNDLAWAPVLDLADALFRPAAAPSAPTSTASAESPWAWSKQSLAELIGKACEHGVPTMYAERFLATLRLLSIEHRSASVSEKRDFFARDHATAALNSLRGKVATALCDWLVWMAKNDPAWKPDEGQFLGSTEGFSEAYALIETHLQDTSDDNACVWAAYAMRANQLRWLNPTWFQERVVARLRLEPRIDADRAPWAFWITFLKFQSAHRVWLKALRSCYGKMAVWLSTRSDADQSTTDVIESYLEHLLIYYWQGDLELGPNSIIESGFTAASPRRRAQALAFVGTALKRQEPPPEHVITRIQDLWQWYWRQFGIADAKHIADRHERRNQHSVFGDWFASGQLGALWSLTQFKDYIEQAPDFIYGQEEFEHLDAWCDDHPELVLDIATALVVADANGWRMSIWQTSVQSILGKTKERQERAVVSARITLLEALVRHGYWSLVEGSGLPLAEH